MEEQWIVLKKINFRKSNKFIPGDTFYISNFGNLRFNNKILSIGNGLYVKGCSLGVCCLPTEQLYRIIYKSFIDNNIDGLQIHHKDYNRLNNHVDNLIALTPYEHGKIHADDYMDDYKAVRDMQEIYAYHERNINKYKKQFKQYLIKRKTLYDNKLEKEKEQIKKEKELIKEKNIKDKINSGDYKYNKCGNLYKAKRPKQSQSLKRKFKEDKIYRERIRESQHALWKNEDYRNNIISKLKGKHCNNHYHLENIEIDGVVYANVKDAMKATGHCKSWVSTHMKRK